MSKGTIIYYGGFTLPDKSASANSIVYKNWKAARKFKILLPFGWFFFGGRYIIRSLFGKRPKIRPQKVAKEAAERMDIYAELRLFEE